VVSPTLNLEIADLHNYFVGRNGLLVHNGSPRPNFRDLTKRPNRIYRIVETLPDGKERVIYVGKTRQGGLDDVHTRFQGHLRKKPEWRGRNLRPEQVHSGEWTEFETAVWEKHILEKYKKIASDKQEGHIVENDAEPIAQETFKKLKRNFRGC